MILTCKCGCSFRPDKEQIELLELGASITPLCEECSFDESTFQTEPAIDEFSDADPGL
jgi:hypothetical protein